MFKKVKIFFSLLVILAIILSFSTGCALIPTSTTTATPGPDVIKQAWDIINKNYVDPSKINTENMTGAAIAGMIDTLNDPYTTYLSPAEFQSFSQNSIAGSFEGIGAVVSVQNNNIVIVSPMSGSPAEKAGIKAGDIIQAINGETTAGMSLDVAISKIRGPSGTPVKLLILHKGETVAVEISVTRAHVDVPSVHFEMRGSYAYIIISQFTERTENEFAPVITQLKNNSAKGIILDLRGNPGGLLNIVVNVASHFITQGVVVQVKSREGVISTESVTPGYAKTNLPMVVLVDEFSASGSEVLTGALQDYGRALIAGNTTYGKGSVTFLYPLSDGSGIYITGSRWLTPNGRLIEGHGIDPDIKLELTGDDEINWAINYLSTGLH